MELRQLRAFARVVRTGTFRAAAAQLHVTQPALWQQVRSLQDELGLALFERVGRRVRVTRVGAELLERADGVMDAADRLADLAAAIREGRGGVVSIATPAPPVQLLLAEVIGELARRHPDVRIEIRDSAGTGGSSVGALIAGEVDLAVSPRRDGLDGFRLYDVHVVLVLEKDHPWARRKRVDVRRLRGVPLLTAPPGSLSRELLDGACASAGFEPSVRLASPSPGMLVALAKNGFGPAVLARDAIVGTGATSTPIVVDGARKLGTEAWLHWRQGADLSPAVRQFVEGVRKRTRTPT